MIITLRYVMIKTKRVYDPAEASDGDRILVYASRLESQDIARIKQDKAGVIWLGKS